MDYTESFLNIANTYPEFKEAVEIIKKNSEGGIWLMGGFVFRSIVENIYGVPMSKNADLDFIVENPKEIKVPDDWVIKKNDYGNPKLVGPSFYIDCIPLKNVHSIIRRKLEPTIENFLSGTPLNIQSIIFDVIKNKVMGDIGIKSIQERIVSVNDPIQAEYRAGKKGVTVSDLVRNLADELGFKAVMIKN